jgi:hypothetical protein
MLDSAADNVRQKVPTKRYGETLHDCTWEETGRCFDALSFSHETKLLIIPVDRQNMIYINPVSHISSSNADLGRSASVQSEHPVVRL